MLWSTGKIMEIKFLEKFWKFTLMKNFENFWAKNLVQKWFEWWKILQPFMIVFWEHWRHLSVIIKVHRLFVSTSRRIKLGQIRAIQRLGFVGQHSLCSTNILYHEAFIHRNANFSSCFGARKRLKKRPFSMVTTTETDGSTGENNLQPKSPTDACP